MTSLVLVFDGDLTLSTITLASETVMTKAFSLALPPGPGSAAENHVEELRLGILRRHFDSEFARTESRARRTGSATA
jgi:hypothetical protein